MDKEKFISKYINEINSPNFKKSECFEEMKHIFGSYTNLKNHLKNEFINQLGDDSFSKKLIERFNEFKCVKNKIAKIASEYLIYEKDLEDFYRKFYFKKIKDTLEENNNKLKGVMIDGIMNEVKKNSEQGYYRFIRSDFKKLTEKMIDLLSIGGFAKNIQNINSGIMTANAGDSAQFLFLSRAILAGYNCSNVDVRSSRYDAIIDFNNTLLRVQVKGISDSQVYLTDRARGGQGIDYTHERNKGKRITSDDCDLYVAIDKDNGICFILPMKEIEKKYQSLDRINTSELEMYKENWLIIKNVVENKITQQNTQD